MKIIPVTEDLKENFPSILGAERPFIPEIFTKARAPQHSYNRPFSRMNPLSPPSVCAQMMKTSAMGEFVIQFLLPFNTQTLASLSYLALVSMWAGSDPWLGSVRPKQPTISPLASLGRYFSLWASLPAHPTLY